MKNYCGWLNKKTFSGPGYDQIISELENFQFNFVGKDKNYHKGWILFNDQRIVGSDLISNWSRQYEYPYVAINLIDGDKNLKILDVGSGYSFFPSYVRSLGFDITCSDLLDLENLYNGSGVSFIRDNIEETKIKDKYDIIYSISVFEHLSDKAKAVENIYNLLKPEGKLILTMDCDLNLNMDEFTPNYGDLAKLIDILNLKFNKVADFNLTRDDDFITSDVFIGKNDWRLPWKNSNSTKNRIKNLLTLNFHNYIPSVGVFVGIWEKK